MAEAADAATSKFSKQQWEAFYEAVKSDDEINNSLIHRHVATALNEAMPGDKDRQQTKHPYPYYPPSLWHPKKYPVPDLVPDLIPDLVPDLVPDLALPIGRALYYRALFIGSLGPYRALFKSLFKSLCV
jgi:hypothetical protein